MDACGLTAIGMTEVGGVHGRRMVETYLVNIYLPQGIVFMGVQATKVNLGDANILIGMSIISTGDFAVTGKGASLLIAPVSKGF